MEKKHFPTVLYPGASRHASPTGQGEAKPKSNPRGGGGKWSHPHPLSRIEASCRFVAGADSQLPTQFASQSPPRPPGGSGRGPGGVEAGVDEEELGALARGEGEQPRVLLAVDGGSLPPRLPRRPPLPTPPARLLGRGFLSVDRTPKSGDRLAQKKAPKKKPKKIKTKKNPKLKASTGPSSASKGLKVDDLDRFWRLE